MYIIFIIYMYYICNVCILHIYVHYIYIPYHILFYMYTFIFNSKSYLYLSWQAGKSFDTCEGPRLVQFFIYTGIEYAIKNDRGPNIGMDGNSNCILILQIFITAQEEALF